MATKLTATLSPAEMREDAWIGWVPAEPVLPVIYSRKAAAIWALNVFVASAVAGWMLLAVFSKWGRLIGSRWKLLAGVGTLAVLTYLALPKTDIVLIESGRPSIVIFKILDGTIALAGMEQDNAIKDGNNHKPITFEELRRWGRTYGDLSSDSSRFIIPFTGQPIKNEPTPGNIILRKSTNNAVDCVWFDIDGIAHVLATFKE